MIRARSLHFAALSVLLAWAFCCLVSGTGMAAPAVSGSIPETETMLRPELLRDRPGGRLTGLPAANWSLGMWCRLHVEAVSTVVWKFVSRVRLSPRSVLQVTGEKTFRPPYLQIPIQRVSVIASVLRAITCMSNTWRLPTPLQRYRNGTDRFFCRDVAVGCCFDRLCGPALRGTEL